MASNKLLNGKERGKVTKKDIHKMGLYSVIEQSSFSFERMQACGFTESMIPTAKKIFKDSDEDMKEFMQYNEYRNAYGAFPDGNYYCHGRSWRRS